MGAPSSLGFSLGQTFFGFSAKHQKEFHDQLFDLLWVGDGKWTFEDIYNLPLQVRRLWIDKINNYTQEKQAAIKQANRSNKTKTPFKK